MAFYLISFESIVFYLHALHFTSSLNPYIIPPSHPEICGNGVVCKECGACLSDKSENVKKEYCHKNFLAIDQTNFDTQSGKIFTMDCNSIDMCAVQDHCNKQNSEKCVKMFGSFYCHCKDHFYGQSCSIQNDEVERSDYARDISIMYAPYSNARDKSIFLVVIGNKGKNLEVHLDYGLGFTIIQNEKSSSYEIPKQVCTDCNIATIRLCNFLKQKEHQTVFYFDTTYPVNKKMDDMLVLSQHKKREIEVGRRYQITLRVLNKVEKPNWEPLQFKMIYNKVVWFDVFEGSICVPVVDLKYCGKTDVKNYFSYLSKDKEIASTVSSQAVCKDKIKRRWQFWKFDVNFDENDKPVIDQETDDDESTYKIKKFTMEHGIYIIKLTGIYTNGDKQLSNFAYCFHEIRTEPFEPIIFGGSTRYMNYKNDLILDAHESKDPNKPPDRQDHLRYYWICLSDSDIKPYNTSESKYIIKGPFKPNKIYIFNLTLYSADGYLKPEMVTQEIEMSGADVSNLLLICNKNCGTPGYKSNPHEIIFLEVLVEGEPVGNSSVKYVWTYFKIGKARKNVTHIQQHGTPAHVLIIDEDKLDVNSTYIFSVSGEGESKATYIIETSTNPIMGNCSISPLEGIIGETNFTVACDNFKSSQKDQFLRYEYYNKKINDTGYGLYLGSNQIGNISEILLVGEIVLIRITDSIFMYVEVNFTLNLIKKEFSEAEVDQKLTELAFLHKSGDETGLMGMIAVVAEVANNSVGMRNKILKNSLEALKEIDDLNLDYIKLLTSGLLNLLNSVEDDDGFDSSTVQVIGYIMRNMANSLKHRMTDDLNVNRQFETSTVQKIAQNMVECSDSLLIRDSDPILTKRVLSVKEEDIVLKYREGFVTMLNSLETMAQSIGHRLMPYETRFTTNSTSVSVWARKSGSPNEMGAYISTEDSELNISPELATELEHTPGYFIVEVVSIKKNPFWWYQGKNNDVQSNILSIKMRKQNKGSRKLFSHLNNHLDIFLDLTPAAPTPIYGTVYQIQSDDDDDTKDLTVSVHRIDSDIGAKLFLEFLKPPVPFKVLVLKDMIPDYDYMEELAITVTEENPRYEVKDTIIKSDSFFYVGILPDITATSNNKSQFEYSFNVLTVNCKIWRETIFSNKGCEVAQDSTTKKLHCVCKHLSIFGGSGFVPPHIINPVEDFKLFLTLKDNPAVFIAVISLLIFYIIFLMWARYKDNAAEVQRTVVVLEDNFPGEEFGYLVTVYTGARLNSGTNANVGITLFGTNHRSRAHILKSPDRATMQRNNDDWFLLFTPVHLGDLCHIHVWHDNKGGSGDWYCEKILVYDLETEEEYVFPLEQWMAPGENEYLEVYMAPIPKTEAHTRSNLVFENTLLGFREMHVWASIINRHPRSSVTRSHRLAVCMSAVMVSMLSSIMYYDLMADEEDEPFFSINEREIWVTVQSAIMAAPVLYLVLFLFQKTEYKKEVKLIEENISQRKSSVGTDVRKTKISNIIEENRDRETQHNVTSKTSRFSHMENTGKFYNLYSKTVHKVIKTRPLNPVKIPLVTGKQPLKRKKGWLIAAWVTSQLVIFICAFFIIMYGLKLGKVKSELWLVTTAGAVGQDVFLSTPLKIIAISFLLGYAYGRLFEVATYDLNTEYAIHSELRGNKDFIYNLQKLRSQPMYYPLSRTEVLAFRAKRRKFIRWATFLEFLIILSFSISLIFLVRSMYSAKYFYKNEEIRNMLTEQISSTIHAFNDINDMNTYINYLSYNFLPKVYQTLFNDIIQEDYDTKFGDTGWFIDETHKLVGVPRVRQIRVKKDKCAISDLIKRANISVICTANLNGNTEEKRNFEFSWDDENIGKDPTPSPWVYVNADKSETISMTGPSGKTYHGGGYIVNLGRTMKETNFTLSELIYADWLNGESQFVIVELTLYTVNTNAFSLVEFMVENLPGGIFLKECQVHSLQVTKDVEFWSITFVVFTAFFLFKNLYTLNQQGLLNYFSQFWNFFEILILFLSLTNFAVHIAHIFYSSQKIQDFQMKGKDAFFSYTALLYYYYIIVILLFLLVICCTIRLLRTFKLGRRVIVIYYTISFSIRSVICITIIFILCLLLQSIIVSYRLNEPFINTWKMFFTYKTGYRSILERSVYPHKRIVVFIFCLSAALFNGVFIVLYSYFYKIAKSHKLLKPELLNYFVLMKNQLEKLFTGVCKKRKNPEVYYSTRLRGGMDTLTPCLPKSFEKLMLLRIKHFIKSRIIYAENTQGIKKRRLKSDSYKCTKRISEILEFEKYPSEYCKFKISDFDFKLSCVISKIDDILLNENTENNME